MIIDLEVRHVHLIFFLLLAFFEPVRPPHDAVVVLHLLQEHIFELVLKIFLPLLRSQAFREVEVIPPVLEEVVLILVSEGLELVLESLLEPVLEVADLELCIVRTHVR